jgi:osmotically-inducible protein OsmY
MKRYAVIALALTLAQCSGAHGGQLGNRAGSVVKDAYIVAAAHARLIAIDPDSAAHVRVDSNRGIVTLQGQAKSAGERARYAAAVSAIGGVRSVRDDLTVNPHLRGISERTSDVVLQARVETAIAGQAGTNVFHVSTSVRSGVVTLHGTVPNALEERIVVQTAQGVRGVRGVVNELAIRR